MFIIRISFAHTTPKPQKGAKRVEEQNRRSGRGRRVKLAAVYLLAALAAALGWLNACLPEHPKKLRATDYADIIICAPIAFTEKGRLLECLSGHMAYNKESKLIQDLRRESYEDEKNNPKSTGFQQKESPESLLLVFIGTFSDSM